MTGEERIAELERQLAAERERAEKAEATCVAYHAMLDELADAAGLRDGCCEFCGIGPSQAGAAHDEDCIGPRLLALLAEPNPGGDLLEAGRAMYRALQGMDTKCCWSRSLLCVDDHDSDCPVGQALATGKRWFAEAPDA